MQTIPAQKSYFSRGGGQLSLIRRSLSRLSVCAAVLFAAFAANAVGNSAWHYHQIYEMGTVDRDTPSNSSAVPTAARLAFKGLTLADFVENIKAEKMVASAYFSGSWVTAKGTLASLYNFQSYPSGGAPTKAVGVFKLNDGTYKCIAVEFTDGNDGVYARAIQAGYYENGNYNYQCCALDDATGAVTYPGLTLVHTNGAKKTTLAVASTWTGNHYGVFGLRASRLVNTSGFTVFTSSDENDPLTVDDIRNHELTAIFAGGWAADAVVNAYHRRLVRGENGVVTNMTVQFQLLDGSSVKYLAVSFTNGVDGVVATAIKPGYGQTSDGYHLGSDFYNEDTQTWYSYDNKGRVAASLNAGGYVIYDIVAKSTDFVWTGAANDGLLATPGNWTVNGATATAAPVAKNALIFTNDAPLAVTVGADATVRALVLDGAAAVTLANSGTLTVTDELSGTGNLVVAEGGLALAPTVVNTGSGTVTLKDSTTLTVPFTSGGFSATENMTLALDPLTSGTVTLALDFSAAVPTPGTSYTVFSSGIDSATLARLDIDSDYTPTVENDALKVSVTPTAHTWTGGGADNNWSTLANWNSGKAIHVLDHIRFASGTLTHDSTVFDAGCTVDFGDIVADSGAWTTAVSQAHCFTEKPIQVESGAEFALTGASGIENPFSTELNANSIAGVLDLGGAVQTIKAHCSSEAEGHVQETLLDGGEIRNGTVNLSFDDNVMRMKNTTFTVGEGATLNFPHRLFLQGGSHVIVSNGTLDASGNTDARSIIGNNFGSNTGDAWLEILDGGVFKGKTLNLGYGYNGKGDGYMTGRNATVDLGNDGFYLGYDHSSASHLALTNSTLTCGRFQFGENYNKTPGAMTVEFVNTTVKLKDIFYNIIADKASSSMTFDGATLITKENNNEFFHNLDISVTIAGGGLTISNAHNVTVLQTLSGIGSLVKRGGGNLTLSADQSFTGNLVVSNGTLTAAEKSFAGGLVAAAEDGGAVTLAMTNCVFGGSVSIAEGVSFAVPDSETLEKPYVLLTAGGAVSFPARKSATTVNRLFLRGNRLCWGKRPGFALIVR